MQIIKKKKKGKTVNEFCSETSNYSQRTYTKMERRHFSHLNETTEDVVSIWVYPK